MASELEGPNPARIMTFRPSMEQFRDFSRYIAYVEAQGGHRAGLAKIVPPKEWRPRRCYDDIDELVIPAPIQQVVTGQSGLFTQYNIQKKAMTVREFRRIANSDNIKLQSLLFGCFFFRYCTPRYTDFEDLERKYWKNLTFNAPIYGADVNGTLYEKHVDAWNIGRLNTILDIVENESGITIEGVNTPYLYFGMWKTSFAWHTEDMDLYSFLDVGKEYHKILESKCAQSCEAFLRHKMTLISPSILKKYGIPFDKVTQEAGEFMITFPYSYHAGFNHGFNCAESTNFATLRWIEYGKQSVLCSCRKDMVKISMDVFVRKYQPDRYKLWKAGKDVTVIDHTLPTPEAAEFLKGDLMQKVKSGKQYAEEMETGETCKEEVDGDETKSVPKHRIGTKRHRVCLEVPQEVSESEAFPKEELSSAQDEADTAQPCEIPTSEAGQQGEQGLSVFFLLDCGGSAKFEELKAVKLEEEEEEEQEAAALDLSISHASNSTSVLPTSKQSATCSVQPGSPAYSGSSDSESTDLLPKRTVPGPAGVLTVHSYAKGDASGSDSEQTSGKKTSATASMNEQELAEAAKEYIRSMKESKKSKGRRQPLSKLPRHHPLLVKDCISDDEASEQLTPEEEAEETEAWAKPLSQLWQNRPPNFEAEKEYNRTMAQQSPYCAVCMLFQTYQAECGGNNGKIRTKPLIPEMCFTTTGCSTDLNLSTPYLEEDGTSVLITCRNCQVCVHASCYGVPPDKATEDWMCSRCTENALEEDCCLCSLRGGALQRANDDKWVHVMCAVAVLEAKFVNIAERSPVDVGKIPLQRFRLKCIFCKKRRKRIAGCCVQCSHGRCPTSFHVSCAQAAGVMMQPDDWPFVVFITCFRHKIPSQAERAKAALQDLSPGQIVISKHKNGRFYQCEVVSLAKETFYEVNFDDGSFSDNLYPEDIVSRDCLQLGPPAEGEVVQVRWTDGQVYGAKFVASHAIQMYQVQNCLKTYCSRQPDDSNRAVCKAGRSYSMSIASDMRFTEIFAEKEVRQERKRQRVINSRYREDYIEPALYRAIME
uniref:Lysine-specific demethylase 4A n=1 Tax=Anas platyrhynchos TaxID=8839 RepID=A0A8B9TPW9_ANAPL